MKEFIEKLIGRLEEYLQSEKNFKKIVDTNKEIKNPVVSRTIGRIEAYESTIKIVNQFAEEYNQEHDDTDYANIELYAFWQKHQWIPCSEKKPRMIDAVLVCEKDGFMNVAIRGQAGKFYDTYANVLDDVVAWMPLPEPFKPKEGRE